MFNVIWKANKRAVESNTLILESDLNTGSMYKLMNGEVTIDDIEFKNAFREPISRRNRLVKIKDMIIIRVERV